VIFNLWLLIRPSKDIPGEWLAYCPDVDVVTQGRSLEHAYRMGREAVLMVLEDDLAGGRDPLERRAEAKQWAKLRSVLLGGKSLALAKALRSKRPISLATSIRLAVDHSTKRPREREPLLLAWTKPVLAKTG
jgi:predicted RNase H-like HicB family nuclease